MSTIKTLVLSVFLIPISFYGGWTFHDYRTTTWHFDCPLPYKSVLQQYEATGDETLYNKHKKDLITYYSTAYLSQVNTICRAARNYFATLCSTKRSVIIFDVDDTALYNYHHMDKFEFIWRLQPELLKARENNKPLVIKSVLVLYNWLKQLGFTFIFLTSRSAGNSGYEQTHRELSETGYTEFERLICMPDELAFDKTVKTAQWKLSMRKELADKYDIVGCVGDRDSDFEGGFTGYIVKLPNYLY